MNVVPGKRQVFKFWRALEALTPQKADTENSSDKYAPIYSIKENAQFPWGNPNHLNKPLGKNKVWRYMLQCGIYDTREIDKLLRKKIGSHEDVFDGNRKEVQSRLFDLGFDENGYPIPESFVLSLACWSSGQILSYDNGIEVLDAGGRIDASELKQKNEAVSDVALAESGYRGFDELSWRFIYWLTVESGVLRKNGTPPNKAWLDSCVGSVARRCFLPKMISEMIFSKKPDYIAKCRQIDKKAIPKRSEPHDCDRAAQIGDLINSFFIGDLKLLNESWERNDVGVGFTEYMTAATLQENRKRIDLRLMEGVREAYQLLSPDRVPCGCWPSDHSLAFSQQLAVNEIWNKFANGTGIFAVNGPPGTGKTTLLRDIVAAVVVDRARKLVSASCKKNGLLFKRKATKKLGDTWIPYYEFGKWIEGSAIVVASSNNGAVENVSLELPSIRSVPERVAENDKYNYFRALATSVLGKPSWGLLATRLGNKKNRREFLEAFWWKEPVKCSRTDEIKDTSPGKTGEEGLRYHLKQVQDGRRDPFLLWEDTVKCFNEALRREGDIRNYLVDTAELPRRIRSVKEEIGKIEVTVKNLRQDRMEHSNLVQILESETGRLAGGCSRQRDDLNEVRVTLTNHNMEKPGFMVLLATFGRSHREWWSRRCQIEAKMDDLAKELASQEKACSKNKERIAVEKEQFNDLTIRLNEEQNILAEKRNEISALNLKISLEKKSLGANWPELDGDDEVREKSSPWAIEKWRRAREEVFLLALNLHRAFIENHPTEMLTNLNLVSDWMKGKRMPEVMARTALDSLCFVVPVISTTFASVPRMFADLGSEKIGWLLIDEAGQSLPQHAAGAIWRSARSVVVGDPMQLEPVSAVPSATEGAIAKYYDVDNSWWPSGTSAQRLADQTTNIGTWLLGDGEKKIWIGCPLRVHRRCDDPMFSISNRIAYDGLMVYGKPNGESPLPKSKWIDIRGENSQGHWFPEEGAATRELIEQLIRNYGMDQENFFLISPFKDCAKQLRRLTRELKLDKMGQGKIGTVHTSQGKEADVVILVLGGDPKNTGAGAKDWVARKPNLLNVAVSRAKKRLYVIGNLEEWRQRPFFRVVVEHLIRL